MLLLAGTAVYAQMAPMEENVPQRPKFTKSQAELLIPRPLLQPVRSMIPSNAGAIDTLDTANPLVKLVLYSDNTWKYVKDGNLLKQEDYFTKNWDNQSMEPYGVDFKSLPDKVTLWLIDNPTDFCCPNQVKVFSKFGFRHKRRHQGCDLPLKTGDPIRAAFAGKVRVSDWSRGYGNLIVIRHENGLETAYGHLSARNVKEGDWVSAGDIIGLGGSTGRSSGPHLHFETRYMGYAFDPEWLIDFETGTLRSGVYSRALERADVDFLLPNDAERDELMRLIYDVVKASRPLAPEEESWHALLAALRDRGAETFILGCTELPILAEALPDPGPFVDPTLELARAAIRFCGYEVKA